MEELHHLAIGGMTLETNLDTPKEFEVLVSEKLPVSTNHVFWTAQTNFVHSSVMMSSFLDMYFEITRKLYY